MRIWMLFLVHATLYHLVPHSNPMPLTYKFKHAVKEPYETGRAEFEKWAFFHFKTWRYNKIPPSRPPTPRVIKLDLSISLEGSRKVIVEFVLVGGWLLEVV